MRVRDGMSNIVLTLGPQHTLREAAARMSERNVGAVVVADPDAPGIGILTERDLLFSLGGGENPDEERVGDHLTTASVYAAPDWSLEEASVAMIRGGFRHLVVLEHGEVVGIVSMRDIVRCWSEDGALCDVPASAELSSAAS